MLWKQLQHPITLEHSALARQHQAIAPVHCIFEGAFYTPHEPICLVRGLLSLVLRLGSVGSCCVVLRGSCQPGEGGQIPQDRDEPPGCLLRFLRLQQKA